LLAVEEIDQIIINTDARAILHVNGLQETDRIVIRDRKAHLCGDEISMNLVIRDDIENTNADIYLMTHTTNPLMQTSTIRKALEKFIDLKSAGVADSLFTVNKIQSRFYREDMSPVNHDPNRLIPTQDLEPWYEENSNLYIFDKDSFMKSNARIGISPRMIETKRFESVDIDTSEDWDMAVIAAEYLLKKGALDV
jgi:CMP-N-acetylneuraminic acid synthetase